MTEVYRQEQQEASDELLRSQRAAVRACEEVSRKNFAYVDKRQHTSDFDRMCEELAQSKRAAAEAVAQRDLAIEIIKRFVDDLSEDCHGNVIIAIEDNLERMREYLKAI